MTKSPDSARASSSSHLALPTGGNSFLTLLETIPRNKSSPRPRNCPRNKALLKLEKLRINRQILNQLLRRT